VNFWTPCKQRVTTIPKITKSKVDTTKPTGKPAFIWDDEVKGFGLLVLPSGVKSYVFQYRTPQGRSRRATIGKASATLTAEQARAKAKALRRAVEDGRDPLDERQEQRDALTVAELLTLYLESARFAEKATSTQAVDRGRITRHLLPTLGKKYITKLTTEDVRRAFAAIRDGKTATDEKTGNRGRAIVKGGEGTARSAVRLFRAVMTWAIDEGMAKDNPAAAVKIGVDGQRDVILETVEEYERLFRTLDKMQAELRIRPAAADAIRVIALTGARRNEIAALKWQHVDLKAGRIVLPPASHKTGAKTGKPRIIGLPAAAAAIIAKQPEGAPEAFVFAPARGAGAIALSKPWRDVRAEAKLPEGIGLHGLRHSLASMLAVGGAQAADLMTLLGHRQMSTTQRYIHYADDKRSELAERAASPITAALNGSGKPAEVAKIRRVK
jgi:integrase